MLLALWCVHHYYERYAREQLMMMLHLECQWDVEPDLLEENKLM